MGNRSSLSVSPSKVSARRCFALQPSAMTRRISLSLPVAPVRCIWWEGNSTRDGLIMTKTLHWLANRAFRPRQELSPHSTTVAEFVISCATRSRANALCFCAFVLLCVFRPAHAAPPANDACANARVITLGPNAFTNEEATLDGPGVSCATSVGHDVWFHFDSTFTGTLTASTCGDADFDTV